MLVNKKKDITLLNELKKIKNDFVAALGGSGRQLPPPYKISRKVFVLLSFEFQVILMFRIYSQLFRLPLLKPLSLFIYQLSKFIYKCDIHPGASIGSGFHLVHGFSVIIGGDAVIGDNVCLFDGVSIGKKNVGGADSMPKIGNSVIIGTGAKILGGLEIGNNCLVGANSVVISSVREEGVTIVGSPAKNISKKKEI